MSSKPQHLAAWRGANGSPQGLQKAIPPAQGTENRFFLQNPLILRKGTIPFPPPSFVCTLSSKTHTYSRAPQAAPIPLHTPLDAGAHRLPGAGVPLALRWPTLFMLAAYKLAD